MVSPGYGSGSAESETSSTRSGRVASSGRSLRVVAQKRDAAVGDGLRLRFVFGQGKFFVEVLDIDEAIFVEAEARFGCRMRRTDSSMRAAEMRPDLTASSSEPWPRPEPEA